MPARRAHVFQHVHDAGTHGDVLNLHTEFFFFVHTHGEAGGHRQFCLPKIAHVWSSRDSEVYIYIYVYRVFRLLGGVFSTTNVCKLTF